MGIIFLAPLKPQLGVGEGKDRTLWQTQKGAERASRALLLS